ncbi:nitrous oxide reductase family maturation protein NosD [Aquabacterium sp. OR-4]|uniref:nitrous oxide reductase family maturation protein NosD n=1 Tax=Aquabacterium sp. OR-4 TaxID=2978127 RepID=UPI0021B3A118|nr:nitrous oxide reductase family maturation protein NosD [Aquabacterium sp. OR-4]MDT7833674.1 nitrous oxide reductase family maturation protein NosD [Aquabacterium sp. OR-4]
MADTLSRRGLGIAARLLAATLACTLPAAPLQAATWRVQPGQAIQPVIARAAAGDVVEITAGFYDENLRIDKPLTLRGLDTGTGRPTISGGQRGDTIRVAAADVTIEDLIVRDSGQALVSQHAGIYLQPGSHRAVVQRCDLTYNLFGLWIEKADQVRIERNVITGLRDLHSPQRGNGVQLYNTRGAHIIGNHISFVRDALYVDVSHDAVFRGNRLHHSRYGTHYMNSYRNLWEDNDSYLNRGGLALMEVRDNIVRNNRTWGNSDHGIMLRTLQDSVIEGNVVAGNARGFFIYDVEYATLRGNLVVDNAVGVHLAALSTRNVVHGNDFIGNREQVRYVGSRDEAWGASARAAAGARAGAAGRAGDGVDGGGGNHWSNYRGWDRNADGRGDVPYEANDLIDRLQYRHPAMGLLMGSPAVQALRLIGQQFPVLRAPSVVDAAPRMHPIHKNWSDWIGHRFH